MDGEKLVGMTLEMAQTLCEDDDVLWDEYYITSVRSLKVNGVSQKLNKDKRNNRLNVYVVNDKITELLWRG